MRLCAAVLVAACMLPTSLCAQPDSTPSPAAERTGAVPAPDRSDAKASIADTKSADTKSAAPDAKAGSAEAKSATPGAKGGAAAKGTPRDAKAAAPAGKSPVESASRTAPGSSPVAKAPAGGGSGPAAASPPDKGAPPAPGSTAAAGRAAAASPQTIARPAVSAVALACIRPLTAAEPPAQNQRASLRLAEGISQFEQGRLVTAFHNLRGALTGGLSDPVEIAMANKYLGFYFCSTGARALCERHFEAALLASPGFDLAPPEKAAAPWAEAYEAVYRRLTTDCRAPDVQGPGEQSGIFMDQPPSGIRPTSSVMDGQAPAPAVLRFAVRPWGDVYLNGKRWLTTPPVKEVQLAPGRHRIEIRNGGLRPFATDFTFVPGGQFLLRHDF